MVPRASGSAMLPPPAPISIMSMTGVRTGSPLPALKSCASRDLECVDLHRLSLAHQRPFRGGASHVEGKQVRKREGAAVHRGHQGAGGRSRLDDAHRKAPGKGRGQGAAARAHHVEAPAKTEAAESALDALQVAVEHRPGVGVDAGGGEALVLSPSREDFRRRGDKELRKRRLDHPPKRFLVGRIGVGVQQTDRERLDAFLPHQLLHRDAGRFDVEGALHRAVEAHALGHFPAPRAGHDRVGKGDAQVEDVVALLLAHVRNVAKSLP